MHALRRYRKEHKLSLAALAALVGTSKATLHRLETGKYMDTADLVLLRKLVAFTGIPAKDLHCGLAELVRTNRK